MCRRCKNLGAVLLSVSAGVLIALICPGWLIAALLIAAAAALGILIFCKN